MTLAFGISSFRLNSIRLCKRSNFTWKVFIFKLSASFPMCDCFKLDIISHFSLQGEVLYHPNSISERILRCQQNASEKKELKSGCFPFLYLCLSLSLFPWAKKASQPFLQRRNFHHSNWDAYVQYGNDLPFVSGIFKQLEKRPSAVLLLEIIGGNVCCPLLSWNIIVCAIDEILSLEYVRCLAKTYLLFFFVHFSSSSSPLLIPQHKFI